MKEIVVCRWCGEKINFIHLEGKVKCKCCDEVADTIEELCTTKEHYDKRCDIRQCENCDFYDNTTEGVCGVSGECYGCAENCSDYMEY